MNSTLNSVLTTNPYNRTSRNSDWGFVFNILVPDLMLFTVSASLVFALLLYVFH